MKKTKIILSIIVFAFIAGSCRDEMPVANRPFDYGEDFPSIFESFWTGMNNNYTFWDVDPTDWDAVYHTYKPKFAVLDINEPQDIVTAFEYFEEMTKDLVDGHLAILVEEKYQDVLGSAGINPVINPSAKRHSQKSDYHDHALLQKFILSTLPDKYLDNALKGVAQTDKQFAMIQGNINSNLANGKNICYLHFTSFAMTKYFFSGQDLQGTPISDILEEFAEAVSNPSLDGVIIDLRGNGGGAAADLRLLWANILMGRDVLAGYDRKKIGDGRLDYGPRTPFYLQTLPADALEDIYAKTGINFSTNPHPVTAPIVVIADLNSVSCSEITTIALSNLPNGYFVGEATWGGQGKLSPENKTHLLYNAGQFNTSFFSMVYTPFIIFEAPDGKCYEGKGYSPKDAPRGYEVKYNAAAIQAGNDPQLEKAIEVIITNSK